MSSYPFVCGYCQKAGQSDMPNKRYCDDFCRLAAARERRRKPVLEDDSCVFNTGVMCTAHTKCRACGWNPAVAELRKARLGV